MKRKIKESQLNKLLQEKSVLTNAVHQMQLELELEEYHKSHAGFGFGKIEAGDIVIINKAILFDILEKRITEQKVKIEDLFLICHAPNGLEGDQKVKTPYGDLIVFFINQPIRSSWLLHRSKYNYPKVSKVSTKHIHKTADELIKDHLATYDPTKIAPTDQFNLNYAGKYRNEA